MLPGFLSDLVVDLRQMSRSYKSLLEPPVSESGVSACFHPVWLRRVLEVVIDNAELELVGSGRPDGKIQISARVEDGVAKIRVQDNGRGVPETVQNTLFTGLARSAEPERSGLGLLIAWAILQEYDGRIAVRSDPREGGTEVTISLQVAGSEVG